MEIAYHQAHPLLSHEPAIVKLPILLLLALISVPTAETAIAADKREAFVAAEAALERGDTEGFEALLAKLKDYPLYPYLRYTQLSRRFSSAEPNEIAGFLRDYADTRQADFLRRAWLKRLAKEERWEEYVRFYVPDDSTVRRCHYLRGLLLSGRRDEAFGQVRSLWLTGKSLPNACDPLLEAWKQAGELTTDLVWQRIVLAMNAGEIKLAAYLGKSLLAIDRPWLERWLAVHRDPRLVLDKDGIKGTHPQQSRILAYGIARLARKTPNAAAEAWDKIASQHIFPAAQAQEANAALGFALVGRDDRRGLSYLDRIPATADNFNLQEQRLRTALKLGYWNGVADWIDAMPDGQRKSEHWLYWQARAEEIRGNREKAHSLFAAAAGERSLWGFLAAERAELPYKLANEQAPADPAALARIDRSAAAARIRELEALSRDLDVNREWYRLTKDMDSQDLIAAAVIAQRRGWVNRAIFTLAKSGYWDDLELRFPLQHRDLVSAQARATGLDEAWIYAILRQESAFNPRARSHAGARGLMQLMPATAREVARALGLPGPATNDLYDPELNITLGSGYMLKMQQRYRGNAVLATAAYNAGPGNVNRWLPEQPDSADVWIATIPFNETRGYVRRVLAYRLIYDYRLGNPIKPLHSLMWPVHGKLPTKSGQKPGDRSG